MVYPICGALPRVHKSLFKTGEIFIMAMTIIGIVLIVAAIFLVISVLMQQGKSHNLSGAIAGASETFFGKSKATTMNHKLQVITTVVAIVFVVLVLVAYLVQSTGNTQPELTPATQATSGSVHDHDHSSVEGSAAPSESGSGAEDAAPSESGSATEGTDPTPAE